MKRRMRALVMLDNGKEKFPPGSFYFAEAPKEVESLLASMSAVLDEEPLVIVQVEEPVVTDLQEQPGAILTPEPPTKPPAVPASRGKRKK